MREVDFLGSCRMAMVCNGSTHVHMLKWGRSEDRDLTDPRLQGLGANSKSYISSRL
jgi:hypothetical protein